MFFILSLFFLLLVYLYLKYYQHIKIYDPRDVLSAFPDDFGIEYEDVNFSSEDQVLLNGWFVKGALEDVILLCHGNFGNVSTRIDIIKDLQTLGYNVFIFDYRGFGRSNGVPNEKGLYSDVIGAYNYLKERGFSDKNIVVFGRSLGGAVAILLCSLIQDFKGVIIDSTFQSLPILGYDILGYSLPGFLISNRFESIKKIKNIKIPKLIIHSEDDDLIPFHHGEKLYEEAIEPKSFLKIRGLHNNCLAESKDIYMKGIKDFLESLEE